MLIWVKSEEEGVYFSNYNLGVYVTGSLHKYCIPIINIYICLCVHGGVYVCVPLQFSISLSIAISVSTLLSITLPYLNLL